MGSPSCLSRGHGEGGAHEGTCFMKREQVTDQQAAPQERARADRQGFFPFPNRLLSEGRGRPVALAVYACLASTHRAIWTRRGKLGEFEAQAPLSDLADTTGATVKKVRGALAWLTESGFLTCVDPGGNRRAAIYRIEVQRAQNEGNVTPSIPTPYANGDGGKGHVTKGKGTKEGTKGAQSNGNNGNGLDRSPHRLRAHNGAHILEDCKTKTTTPPPPPRTGGTVSQVGRYCLAAEWGRAFLLAGGAVPSEPQALSPEPYRHTVLAKLPHKSEHERNAVSRAMQTWARNGAGGVREFVKAENERREGAEVERAYRARHGLAPGPVFPVLSQREIDAGITEFPTED